MLDDKLNAKIADFGFAQPDSEGIRMRASSRHYKAPEICNQKFPYKGEKADVFSLAITLFAL